ncbi:HEXXH motif domain-containing protein [Streptomyces sp. CB03238]|uniref:HEXXH motif domain-containing protein n=1 Tax=Streptomyces sp. CB03238 TaxID=1907777 RepID=UPI001F4E6432|nr:HEXXH motif domain-containing protein [Streptomyces sp. CB03238]
MFDLLMDALAPLTGVTGPLPAAQRAWDLLAAAQRYAPDPVEELLLLPDTGLWLNRLLARLGACGRDAGPLWADTGHLHTLAAVAAARAGLDFSFPVPAHHGTVWLPTLGLARLPTAHRQGCAWDTAEVRASGGRVTLTGRYGRLHLPSRPERSAPGWLPVRRAALAPGAARHVIVDDLGTHRIAPLPYGAAERLTPTAYDTWSGLLREAYAVLADVDPPTAQAAAVLLRSVQPMPAHEPFRVRSVTSGHGVGGLASSLPDSVALCAATLVHELQHSKLSALMHLCPLYQPEKAGRLYYGPWRDDPRPLGGMLQGAYAFHAVARFWQAYATRRSGEPGGAIARFEYVLWLGQLERVVPELAADPALTAAGRSALQDLLGAVRRRGDGYGDRCGDGPEERLARRMAADHRASWRLAHVRPYPEDVPALAAAWSAGRPPRLPARREAIRDAGHRHLDARAMLARIALADPAALDKMRDTVRDRPGDTVPGVTGASRGDLLWACGDTEGARRFHVRDLSRRTGAWTGLRLALEDTGDAPEAVRALTAVPELVAAVHRAVRDGRGRTPDPVALAHWLGQGALESPYESRSD